MLRFLFLPLLFTTLLSQSQSARFYCDVMVNADDASNRILAAKKFDELFVDRLSQQNSFSDHLKDLSWISVLYAPDSVFRVISWQIKRNEGQYDYRSMIQMKDGSIQSMKGSGKFDDYDTNSCSEQIPMLYYHIAKSEEGYLLNGFRFLDQYSKEKLLDVVRLDNHSLTFGHGKFPQSSSSDEPKSRLIIKYSADAQANIEFYQSTQRIVLDHLITIQGRMPGQGPTMVPDGSYRAYQYESGEWKLIDNFSQFSDIDAPHSSQGRTSDRNLDLFGRKKN